VSRGLGAPAAKLLKLLFGIGVGALLLVLAFRGVADADKETGIAWGDLASAIRATTAWGVAGFLALFFACLVLRTERWRIQVRGLTGHKPARRESLAINAVGSAGVFLLPFRLGELVRPNLSAQRGIMRASAGFAATALERVLDGIVTTGFFGVVILLMHQRDMQLPDEVAVGGWVALTVFGSALLFFVVAFRWREGTARVVERLLGLVHGAFARRAGAMLRGFLDGLACFRQPRDLLAYLALTVVFWLVNGFSMWVLLRGMGIEVDPLAAFFCVCFLVIGMMIPAPPGNVGNFHAFARAALTVFGVAAVPAVAYAIVLHAASVFGLVAWTAVFFLSGDVSFAKVRAATKAPSSGGGG
jgi:glycosyltransferase 2 family protein